MADGVSAIVGVVAFGLHAVHKIVDIVEEIKDAPGDILALRDDALEVGCLLQQLQQSKVLDTVVVTPGGRTQASADRLWDGLREIQSFVGKVSEARQDGTLRFRKIRLFLSSGRCEKLRDTLVSIKSSVTAIVTTSTSQSVLRLLEEHRASWEKLDAFKQDHLKWRTEQRIELAAFRAEVIQMLTMMALRRDPMVLMECAESQSQAQSCELGPRSIALMSMSGPDASQDDMYEPPITSGRPSEASHSEDTSIPTTQRKGTSNSKQLQCENPCECCCHDAKLTRASPPWMAPLFGNLYLPCSFFRRSLTSCNIQTCRRTQKNRQIAKIKFFFPSWFIAVDMKIRLQVFPVHLCLQTPRRVPRTSPIFRCIQRIDIEGVKELLVSGKASVNDVDERGWSVLHHAADLVDYHPYDQACGMLQFLVDEGAHTEWEEEQFHWTPLQFLQQYGLLQQQQESNTGAVSLIQTKIAGPILHGNLIDAWEDWLERCDFSDVHRAVLTNRTRNTSLKDMLASTVADINAPCRRMGRTPLEWGIYLHIPNVVETLLECGADVHKGYPLHQAIFLGDLDALKLLIHAGADLNLQIGDGQTPLHIAAYYGEIEFVEELIRICGDTLNLDVLDNDGHSALDTAKAHRIHYIEMGWQTDGHDKIILTLSKLQKSSDGMPECSRQTHACIEAIEDLRVPGSFPMN